MTIGYHRNNYRADALESTIEHVKCHIASIADPDDDPTTFHDQVNIELSQNEDGSTRVYGTLERDPACDYSLPEDYTPPPDSEYQRGFGERLMNSPQELHDHLMQKETFE
ncbi:hypothetical protein SEA_BENCZKOWSKI14_32 [Gordonia phage Benczkowski14]|uniref:Uncharacterized protein n=3 Tax=Demosthenesvirus katyusha TaxID=1982108 RepID=A0A142KCA9_9CAUD|nr:hypothetical protein BH765_gp32 [Gordonia phage Kvothe]YP_009603306.1 hypothetical protein FDH67_gp32 [Gordonia phage Katyusha]AMS03425.1 hypothetical protein SEA_KATYUSHA_32 [Gordonia phage Katyusha]AMS03742.1 hypothetical protein SEA_BENCZKOWSKI14_32 [Gordonia phage Benczkowski14]ANA86097.1 hypothetical protein PBI_KVOTHE_32 [Gordonia phage Kvothe]